MRSRQTYPLFSKPVLSETVRVTGSSRGQCVRLRTHKIALEAKIGGKLNINHSAIGWMIDHCADTLNKCQVGKDGRTLYERLKGKKYGGTFMEFGSPVMLRVTDKPQGGAMDRGHMAGVQVQHP